MAACTSDVAGEESIVSENPLLNDIVNGAVDYKGRPARRSTSGRWRSALFIIGVEVMERFAYYGIASNLITYLTGPLGQSTAAAAENVNAWSGVASLLPILGGFVADSYLGRYRTIIIASLLYILGLGLLTLSATLASLSTSTCQTTNGIISCLSSSNLEAEVILFYFSLYLVAIAEGGHKPCVQAFGADQFDEYDPRENNAKSSFFNWWYFGLCTGASVTILVVVYIQDNLNWSLGFGIPCIAMVVGLAVFLLGTKSYRYSVSRDENSPFVRIARVFTAAIRNWQNKAPSVVDLEEQGKDVSGQSWEQFKLLNKALFTIDNQSKEKRTLCSLQDVEEAKSGLRLVPIWFTCLVFAIVYAQTSTFFTKQGATLDRRIFSWFEIPAASLQVFIGLSIVIIVPIYDRVFVPLARRFTNIPSGITMLQRIGTGMFLAVLCMITAALVEMKRLKTAEEYGLVDVPNAVIPMSIWLLVPQYVLLGFAEVFVMVGLQEFFYSQVPNELRSIGLSLYLSVLGVGSILSSVLISCIEEVTGSNNGGEGWFQDNLNKAHLDYFYWLLAGFSIVGLAAFTYFARSYIYRPKQIE